MSKRDTMTIVSDRLGLYFGYVIEAATYFPGYQEAFEWLYLSGGNPHQTLNQEELLNKMASVSMAGNARSSGKYTVRIYGFNG